MYNVSLFFSEHPDLVKQKSGIYNPNSLNQIMSTSDPSTWEFPNQLYNNFFILVYHLIIITEMFIALCRRYNI